MSVQFLHFPSQRRGCDEPNWGLTKSILKIRSSTKCLAFFFSIYSTIIYIKNVSCKKLWFFVCLFVSIRLTQLYIFIMTSKNLSLCGTCIMFVEKWNLKHELCELHVKTLTYNTLVLKRDKRYLKRYRFCNYTIINCSSRETESIAEART